MQFYWVFLIITCNMFNVSYLLKYLFAVTSLTSLPDANGWVALEKPLQREQVLAEEDDRQIWVLISKQVDDEHIRLRFPVDPVYAATDEGALTISAIAEGNEFSLEVLPPLSQGEQVRRMQEVFLLQDAMFVGVEQTVAGTYDIQYRHEGKWVFQKWVETQGHFYILEAKMSVLDRAVRDQFFASFSV